MLHVLCQPIIDYLSNELKVTKAVVSKALTSSLPKGVVADICFPCFKFSADPTKLATELTEKFHHPQITTAQIKGFVNFTFDPAYVSNIVMPLISDPVYVLLRSDSGLDKVVCIDFSSPNIAKHLAFHHIRGTMVGNALSHAYKACGWRVERINFLGDWGTSFGRIIAEWKHQNLTLEYFETIVDKVDFLNTLYVTASAKAKKDPAFEEQTRIESKLLEDEDPESTNLWWKFRGVSIGEFQRMYDLLNVSFDSWKGEAHYNKMMTPLLDELQEKGLTSVSKGATVVEIPGFKNPILICRTDGGTLYTTRDIVACDDRYKEYKFDKALYVVDAGQSLHFKEWFEVTKLLGRPYCNNLVHVDYGVLLQWNEETKEWAKFRTKNGKVIMLKDIIEEAIDNAKKIVSEKNPDLTATEKKKIANSVGLGAVIFNILKTNKSSDIKFKLEEALSLVGDTSAYVQFTYARLCSIEKQEPRFEPVDAGLLTHPKEKAVLLSLVKLPTTLEKMVETNDPSVLALDLLSLTHSVSACLSDASLKVLCDDVGLRNARLALVTISRKVIGELLRILGIPITEKM